MSEERAAMRERAHELQAGKNPEQREQEVLAKIAELAKPDRSMAMRLYELVPRTWYGMPAYALTTLGTAEETRVRDLLKRAVGRWPRIRGCPCITLMQDLVHG